MATQQDRQNHINAIIDKNQKVLSFKIEEDLVRKEKLGEDLNFEILRDCFVQIADLIKKVTQCDLTKVPFPNLTSYVKTINQIESIYAQINQFSVSTPDQINVRSRYITNVQNHYESLLEQSTPILLIDMLHNNDLSIEKAKINALTDDISKAKVDSLAIIESSQEELKTTLDVMKRAAAQVGVAQHSFVFKEEADFHLTEAKKWFGWTVGVLVVTALAGLGFLYWTPATAEGTAHIVQFTITKVVVLAVLFYGLSICIKNYRAHKHNNILNKHRQNALQTFETFVKASTDDQTKNAVLLQTTQSIFANQHTGYSSNDSDGDMPSKVIEIIKSTSTKPTN